MLEKCNNLVENYFASLPDNHPFTGDTQEVFCFDNMDNLGNRFYYLIGYLQETPVEVCTFNIAPSIIFAAHCKHLFCTTMQEYSSTSLIICLQLQQIATTALKDLAERNLGYGDHDSIEQFMQHLFTDESIPVWPAECNKGVNPPSGSGLQLPMYVKDQRGNGKCTSHCVLVVCMKLTLFCCLQVLKMKNFWRWKWR